MKGASPLYAACRAGHVGAVDTLIEHGADVNAGSNGAYPVNVAAYNGFTDIIVTLYKHGANMKPSSEHSLLKLAKENVDNDNSDAIAVLEKIMVKLEIACDWCGCTGKRLKLCSKCKSVRYCTLECQHKDYKENHKAVCALVGSKCDEAVETEDV